ncbi:APHP domain-containing protein, partial [Thermococci archaeon]
IAIWTFNALDPQTGELISDPDKGLLLPNTDRAQWGGVTYSIKPWPEYTEGIDLTTGTEIKASARITYDGGTPLDTNIQTATLDMIPPTTSYSVQDLGVGKTGSRSYRITFEATDDPDGSGVKDYTVYISQDGGSWWAWKRRITDTEAEYTAPVGATAEFIVLAADNAGNVEKAPEGVYLPAYNPGINLGVAPTAAQLTPEHNLTTVTPPDVPATNPLFVQAMKQIPAGVSGGSPPAFASVFDPFTMSAFATGIPQSGAGIGSLGIAFSPDGSSVYVSGGEGRNQIWRFTAAGGAADSPLAALDVPVYDMVFDQTGRLWATTGGGPLLRLDPVTGQILGRYGDGIELGIAVHPDSGLLYLDTSTGVEIFDPGTEQFSSFSSTRVHSLAFSPEGTLYATSWPEDGNVLRFDKRGNAEILLIPAAPGIGIAVGQAETPLENLMFITHGDAGFLTMVDLVTLKSVKIADGGTRGGFMHIGTGGRLYVAQGGQVDVFFPITPPVVLATTPVNGMSVLPVVNHADIRFDVDMWSVSADDAQSVTNPDNYRLVNKTTDRRITISRADYDPVKRTVTLQFEPLEAALYELTILPNVRSALGLALPEAYTVDFTVMVDVTDSLKPNFSNTRFDRKSENISFDVSFTNSLDFDILPPYRLIFTGLAGTTATLKDADGTTDQGYPYCELSGADSEKLAPGESTITLTLSVHNPDHLAFDLITLVNVDVGANLPPIISSMPGENAQV